MIRIHVTAPSGAKLDLDLPEGGTLMEGLRDHDLLLGTCGGTCSCGTCHVYLLAGGAEIPSPGEEEQDMLEALADVTVVRADSRLSCQIELRAEIAGLKVEVAPQF